MEEKQYPARVSDAAYNAILKLTANLKVDSEFDIYTGADYDYFRDWETDAAVSLQTGLRWLHGAIAYPLQHDGMTLEESQLIVDVFKEFDIVTDDDDIEWLLLPDEDEE